MFSQVAQSAGRWTRSVLGIEAEDHEGDASGPAADYGGNETTCSPPSTTTKDSESHRKHGAAEDGNTQPPHQAHFPSEPLSKFSSRWTNEAERFERVGALVNGAELIRLMRDDAQRSFWQWWTEPLTIREAADQTGYSRSRLRSLVREGTLNDVGEGGRRRVRRCDLPRKPHRGLHVESNGSSQVGSAMQEARAVVESN